MAVERRFRAMGSDVHVIVVGEPKLADVARVRVGELECLWSRFVPDSEVSLQNASPGSPRRVLRETFRLFATALDGWRLTGGRFDPTVLGDLIREGYDRPFETVALRPGSGLSLLQRNAAGIRLDREAQTVELPKNSAFDPGGVGKGLAADIVVEELMAAGADGACVNIGGDLRVEGRGPDDGRWIVSLDHPTGPEPIGLVGLAAGAVATSTSAKRSWTVEGERRNHLIDPRTGRSLQRRVIGATALSRTAAWAEIATKHAMLADPGFELDALEELGCEGLVVMEDGECVRSSGLGEFEIEPLAKG